MNTTRTGSEPVAIVLGSAVSIFMYQSGLFALFFLVPLEIVFGKRGFRAFAVSSGLMLIGVGFLRYMKFMLPAALPTDFFSVAVDLVLPAVMILGLFLINVPVLKSVGKLKRMLAATAVVGFLGIPAILYLSGNTDFRIILKEQITAVWDFLVEKTGEASMNTAALELVDMDQLLQLSLDVLFSTFLVGYLAVLAMNWRIGIVFSNIYNRNQERPESLSSFRLNDKIIWALLIPWTINFISLLTDFGPVKYIFWNIGFIMIFLYGVQGSGIISSLLEKYTVGRSIRTLFVFAVVFIILVPGVNFLLLAGLPLLGISEVWIKYRKA